MGSNIIQHRKPEVCTERMRSWVCNVFHLSFGISPTKQYFNFGSDRMFTYEKEAKNQWTT